ncbi:ATP-dependent Clp protease proteolytic subunit [Patescibacteria group bacterium]|nr:ATP-dependent Clp protease proteolytic subunit [Patescibacteria group bacterium]MBU4481246.1 ATP-dependent Clp protease proteolytic subunit [Patescibacteria group bacterium]
MNNLKGFIIILIFFGLLFFVFSAQTAIGQTENQIYPVRNDISNGVYLAEIEGEIKAGTLQYLKRVVGEAEKAEAEYLIIKLDTPGGLLKSTKDIIDLLLKTEIKTVVFVHKEGGWAYSAGTFILLAADVAVVHPEASIGASQPQEMFGQEQKVAEKVIEGTVSWIKSLAEIQKRNPEIAEKFVRENLTLIGKEAKEIGIIDETARNLDELFLKLGISEPKIKEIKPTLIEGLFDFLSHPYLISLFLTLGGLGLIFAFRTGEFELTGILGLVLLLIGLWGIGVVTFNFLGIIFLALGIFLLLLEVFQPGFGIFGFLGIVSLLFGVFAFQGEPFLSHQIFEAATMLVLGAVLGIGIFFIIISRGVAKTLKTKPKTGPEALIGLEVEVIEEIKPRGRVKIKEETWSAEKSNGETIPKRTKVEIIKVEGNTLVVKKIC